MRRWLLVLLVAACSPSKKPSAAPPQPDAASDDDTEIGARASTRCGECHAKIRDDWRVSGHAQAATSTLFTALRKDDASCDRCHQPLAGKMDPTLPVVKEGVTCDVCHTMPDVKVTAASASFSLDLGANTKYGPLCDATGHYFHRSHCTPLFKSSEYCAACHHDSRELPGGKSLATFTEYDEWKTAKVAQECQECHMPTYVSSVAVGFHERSVPHHGFLGHDNVLRAKGVTGKVALASVDGGRVKLDVTLHNEAGHSTPAGMPGRQLVLLVKLVKDDGSGKPRTLGGDQRVYARTLVDADGQEVPFQQAVAEQSDTRLKAEETRTESFDLPLRDTPDGVSVDVTLTWRPLSDGLAKAAGPAAPTAGDDQILAHTTLALAGAKLPLETDLMEISGETKHGL